jgi:hypothetical protein
MQTVMQSLIERIRAAHDCIKETDTSYEYGQKMIYEAILNDAEEMIKQEREQIAEAYIAGREFGTQYDDPETGEDYYNQTYVEK